MSYRQTAVRWPSAFYYPGWTNHFSLLIFAHHPPASRQSRWPSGGHRPVCQYSLPQGPNWDVVSQTQFDRCQAEGPISPCHQQATHLPLQPSRHVACNVAKVHHGFTRRLLSAWSPGPSSALLIAASATWWFKPCSPHPTVYPSSPRCPHLATGILLRPSC